MTDEWKYQKRSMLLADALLEQLVAENEPKPTALGTPLRYSSFGECARKVAYTVLEAEPSPPSGAGLYVMQIGTVLHELIQGAIAKRVKDWPESTVEFEVASKLGDNLSGSADGIATTTNNDGDTTRIAIEIKTMGGVKFKKQIGFKDGRGRGSYIDNPAGPALSAIGQAGWNALGNNCDTVLVISYALEAISVGKAIQAGLTDAQRVCAEWWVPEEVWRPLAEMELARQEHILTMLSYGDLPERVGLNDDGYEEVRDIDSHPLCQHYCDYREQCVKDGPGVVPVSIKKGKE